MRRFAAGFALVAACAVVSAGVVALARPTPEATCTLPGVIFCVDDSTCVAYGAFCNTAANQCVCDADAGVDAGGGDLGGSDGFVIADGGGSTPVGGPVIGGGGTAPARSGC